jgi:hypothetical protein
MRCKVFAVTGLLALFFSGGARAQSNNFQSALTGVSPGNISFAPVQVPSGVTVPNASPTSTQSTWFRRPSQVSPTLLQGYSPIPSPQYANGFQPTSPISMTLPAASSGTITFVPVQVPQTVMVQNTPQQSFLARFFRRLNPFATPISPNYIAPAPRLPTTGTISR